MLILPSLAWMVLTLRVDSQHQILWRHATDTMMLKSATTGYIVADDSKFGKVKIARVARLDEPSGLIVNRSASDDFISELEMRNCRVIR